MSAPAAKPTSFKFPVLSPHRLVAERDGADACWRCGLSAKNLLDVAHLLFAHDTDSFLAYIREPVCLIPSSTTHLAHLSNLIILCKNCHALFKLSSPAWVMLPADIEFFIKFERADYAARVSSGKAGILRHRTVPTAGNYPGQLYTLYSLHPEICPPISQDQFPKRWGGAPTIALLKAFLGALQPCSAPQAAGPSGATLPSGLRARLAVLSDLYSRPAPTVKPTNEFGIPDEKKDGAIDGKGGGKYKVNGNDKKEKNSRKGDGGESDKRKQLTEAESPPRKRRTRGLRGKNTKGSCRNPSDSPPASPKTVFGRSIFPPDVPPDNPYMWGPEFTVDHILGESGGLVRRTKD